MTGRPASRTARSRTEHHPSPSDEMDLGVSVHAQETARLAVTPEETRSGEDTRRRGWFWHWNSIVTQYAPLIGLKGIGLLNSYTVWTDRREESPHRGFAFPSQQREADFYGEDRAELITINKILVALDLIEIRKEMVLRADDQGRRWKVPHNFYRVKDHSDGSSLTSRDVLKVAELADRDLAVYRYVRRVFSSRFAAIDRDNVWAEILGEVRATDVWQRLAARAIKDESRASERTRAGHAARKSALFLPADSDNATPDTRLNDSATGHNKGGRATTVEQSNKGLQPDVAPTNNGFDTDSSTAVDPSNTAPPTDVAPSNRTYNQHSLTTTTTTPNHQKRSESMPGPALVDTPPTSSHRSVTSADTPVTVKAGNGPAGHPAPFDAVGEARALSAFEDANGRRSTVAEQTLLRRLADRFEASARRSDSRSYSTGWDWVTAATYEAVEAGSTFVAPRRLREIMNRWERDGLPDAQKTEPDRAPDGGGVASSRALDADGHTGTAPSTKEGVWPDQKIAQGAFELGEAPDIDLPHGFGSRKTWEYTVTLLATAMDPAQLTELVRGSAIIGCRHDLVSIAVLDEVRADRIGGEYRRLFERKLSEAMRRPMRIAVQMKERSANGQANHRKSNDVEGAGVTHEAPVFLVTECGLPSTQVWAAVIDEVAASGSVSRANVDAWLRSTRLIGRGAGDSLVIGTAHTMAQRRIESRFAPPLAAAIEAIVGTERPMEFVVTQDWLAASEFLRHSGLVEEAGAA
jgi:hypothetical protein